jgi:hypothetical protein
MRGIHGLTLFLALMGSIATVHSADLQLSQNIPACKMPPGKPLPVKYYVLARKYKEFRWVYKTKHTDSVIYGEGREGLENSGLYSNLYFYKADINSDGLCDWSVVYQSAPLSSVSRDFEILNTFYLGGEHGWKRIGGSVQESQPDELYVSIKREQHRFSFFADAPIILRDNFQNTTYLLGSFSHADNNHPTAQQVHRYGYRIYTWNPRKNTLQELDKWEPGSAAAQVYAFFKQHGAVDPTQTGADRIVHFDPEFEKSEFDHGCKDEDTLKRSVHFARACESRDTGLGSQ